MKIKMGTVKKDSTAYGNSYWIQIEDSRTNDNRDLEKLVSKPVAVVIGDVQCIQDLIDDSDFIPLPDQNQERLA